MWCVVATLNVVRHANQSVGRDGPVGMCGGDGGAGRWGGRVVAIPGRPGATGTDRSHRGAFGVDVSSGGGCLRFLLVVGAGRGVVRGGVPADSGRAVGVVGLVGAAGPRMAVGGDECGDSTGHGRGVCGQRGGETRGGRGTTVPRRGVGGRSRLLPGGRRLVLPQQSRCPRGGVGYGTGTRAARDDRSGGGVGVRGGGVAGGGGGSLSARCGRGQRTRCLRSGCGAGRGAVSGTGRARSYPGCRDRPHRRRPRRPLDCRRRAWPGSNSHGP